MDSYPHVPEPKQSHSGSALAMLSVFAILAFGIWTAIGTFTGSADNPIFPALGAATAVPTRAAGAAPTPAATVSGTAVPTSGPGASGTAAPTPARTTTPSTGGSRVHVVGPGDTLTRISQTYGTTVDAIMAANGFSDRSKVLHIGDKLNIP
jgi:hypothetical protein